MKTDIVTKIFNNENLRIKASSKRFEEWVCSIQDLFVQELVQSKSDTGTTKANEYVQFCIRAPRIDVSDSHRKKVATGAVRGCRDIFALSAAHRRECVNKFAALCSAYNFYEIETPILERAELFARSLGPTSDVISSEMYHVAATDPQLVLRPEGTAGVARALRDVGLLKCAPAYGTRVWYAGQMFRHERPQQGRYRQFWQLGVEAIGDESVTADVDVIVLAAKYMEQIKCETKLRLNTLGSKTNRREYNEALKAFLQNRYWAMSSLSRKRYDSGNCMRILDSKLPEDIDVMANAPRLEEFVEEEQRERFREVCSLLGEAGVTFCVDNRLVRGLDYYTSTAFEFDGREGKAVCAGGRYLDVCGANGVGFAVGLDRVEKVRCDGIGSFEKGLDGGVAVIGLSKTAEQSGCEVGRVARELTRGLRDRGVKSVSRLEGGRLSKVVGRAVRAGARVVVVVGEKELANGTARIKYVSREGVDEPGEVGVSQVVEQVCERIQSEGGEV